MPGAQLYGFDYNEGKFRKMYNRSDHVYSDSVAGVADTTLLTNNFGTDYIITAAFISADNGAGATADIRLRVVTAASAQVFNFLVVTVASGQKFTATISFPLPLEVQNTNKVFLTCNQAAGSAYGGIFGTREID